MMDTFKRIAYLHQLQSLLNDINEEKDEVKKQSPAGEVVEEDEDERRGTCKLPLTRLNSFFGYLSKEIAMKHNVQM